MLPSSAVELGAETPTEDRTAGGGWVKWDDRIMRED